MDLLIRNETQEDYRQVEELTREAFWNLHVPGCDEHYLIHLMRSHPDFLSELDFVAVLEDRIVGNIMFTKSRLINETNLSIDTITFGPVSVLPEYQKKGIGSALIKHSIKRAIAEAYKVIIIEGHPYNYCKHGFVGSKSVNVSNSEGRFPYSLLVMELKKGCLQNHEWKFYPSSVYNLDKNGIHEYDKLFSPKEKGHKPTQEEYNIASHAFVE
ncbi:MAG: N-acetyltransferase [Leptospiraceae bacterium]|nr:N-acetyltransferase [Leptospiraceae bacterium]MCP5501151.1 N-acetyltransferase [Leptospiraceae bacterium]